MTRVALGLACAVAVTSSLIGCGGDDLPSGRSDSGMPFVPLIHRAAPATCALATRPASNSGSGGSCMLDAECASGTAGRCLNQLGGGCCTYHQCETDADCAVGQVCECGVGPGSQNVCIRADCLTDADCPGGLCARTSGLGYGVLSRGGPMYACTSGSEPCRPGDVCVRSDGGSGYCDFGFSGAWECLGAAADGDWFCSR